MDSALSHLKHGELCTLILKDDTQRDARWDSERRAFFFTDTNRRCEQADIDEWIPACKF